MKQVEIDCHFACNQVTHGQLFVIFSLKGHNFKKPLVMEHDKGKPYQGQDQFYLERAIPPAIIGRTQGEPTNLMVTTIKVAGNNRMNLCIRNLEWKNHSTKRQDMSYH